MQLKPSALAKQMPFVWLDGAPIGPVHDQGWPKHTNNWKIMMSLVRACHCCEPSFGLLQLTSVTHAHNHFLSIHLSHTS